MWFSLFDKYYVFDIEWLCVIEEGGMLFNVLGFGYCFFCGVVFVYYSIDVECNGDIDLVV